MNRREEAEENLLKSRAASRKWGEKRKMEVEDEYPDRCPRKTGGKVGKKMTKEIRLFPRTEKRDF